MPHLLRARSESSAALALARVFDSGKRKTDVLTEVDTLCDEIEVARERCGHDRARESRLRRRVHEAAGSGPRTGREGGRLVDLIVTRAGGRES